MEITHYLFPRFTEGSVLMLNGEKYIATLNYNTLTEEMIFEGENEKLAISKDDLDLMDTIYIQERKFVIMNSEVREVIYNSNWDLFLEHRCNVKEPGKNSGYGGSSQVAAIKNISSIASGRIYDLDLPSDWEARPYFKYWLKKDGELECFRNMRELKQFYKNKRGIFKEYVKANTVRYYNQESIIQLINYLEAN